MTHVMSALFVSFPLWPFKTTYIQSDTHLHTSLSRLKRLPFGSTFQQTTHNLSAFVLATTRKQQLVTASNHQPDHHHSSQQSATKMTTGDNTKAPADSVRDPEYPGTAIERMMNVRARVAQLASGNDLDQTWEEVRRKLLWAGGLKDLSQARPGQGYTGHSFNDFNHVDLTCMLPVDNENNGEIQGIARGNFLGSGIRIASLEELGPGGSWSTCAMGCNKDPPQDVAHIQFKSRIAFKLVWVPNKHFDQFVLVDDNGNLLARGKPSDGPAALPPLRERQYNYQIMAGSKYAKAADAIARNG